MFKIFDHFPVPQADALTARKVCQNLTDLTGKHFHVLVLENADEVKEVTEHLDGLGMKTLHNRF